MAEDSNGRSVGLHLTGERFLKQADTSDYLMAYLSPGVARKDLGDETVLVLLVLHLFAEWDSTVDLETVELEIDGTTHRFESMFEPTVGNIATRLDREGRLWQILDTAVWELGEWAEVTYPIDIGLMKAIEKADKAELCLNTALGVSRHFLRQENKDAFRSFLRHNLHVDY